MPSSRIHRLPTDRWRSLAVVTALACVVASVALPTTSAAIPTPPSADAPPATSGVAHTVTLLTGDRVEYTEHPGAHPRVLVDPAVRPHRRDVTFTSSVVAGPGGRPALYVVPSDAEAYLAAGAVDRELFNVRELTRQGLDDTRANTLPLIVTYRTWPAATPLPASRIARLLPALRGQALRVDRLRAAQFWDGLGPLRSSAGRGPTGLPNVRKVWLDRRVTASLEQSVPQIGAPTAWHAGYDGAGVTVAVLDTGVDQGHPDLQGKVASSSDFTGDGSVVDRHGHGTHVAATIAGSGAASSGRSRGVAPGAKLMVGKVLGDDGSGLESWVVAGMEWAARGGARVISMSLGGEPTDGTDPVSEALNALTAQTGALFVAAAGNSGSTASIGAPGAARAALTVGAVDKQDRMANFSNRGPRLGDGAAKPEIVAPGVDIVAARAAGTGLGNPVDDFYTSMSGTSMATPHVAGAAAILAQRHPAWNAGQLKDGLVSSAKDVGARWTAQGAGRLDIARAVQQDMTAPAAVDLGRVSPTDGVIRRPIRYANSGDQPVALDLRLSLTGWDGRPAPSELGRLSTSRLDVPAGGSATVDLVADLAAGAGLYGGTVMATTAGEQQVLRTLVTSYITPPSSTVTVRMTDYRGQPAPFASVSLVDAATDQSSGNDPFAVPITTAFVSNGTGVAEVRQGAVLTAMTSQTTFAIDTRRTDLLVSPEIAVDDDTEIRLDARQGQTRQIKTTEPSDELAKATEVVRTTPGAIVSMVAFTRIDPDTVTYLTPTPQATLGSLDTYDKRTLAAAGLRMSAAPVNGGSVAAPYGPDVVLQPRYDPYATPTKLAGQRRVGLVWAGEGKPEDLIGVDLTGKVALVGIRIPGGTANPVGFAAQAAAAATQTTSRAGALATAVFVDAPGAVSLARPGAAPIPQLFLSRQEGAVLAGWLRAGPVSVGLNGNPSPMTNHNLFYPASGVPAGGTHVVVPEQLVAIPTRYHADKPMTYEKNWYTFGARSMAAMRERVLFPAPAARVEYVGPPDASVTWHRWITQNEQLPNRPPLIASLIARGSFAPGAWSLPEERWYEGPVLENEPVGNSRGGCGLCRGGPDGNLFIPAWHLGDSSDTHAIQSWPDYRSEVHLFRGGTEVAAEPPSNSLPMPTFRLPAPPDSYRLVVDGPTPWNPSVRPVHRTTTEWTFRSAPSPAPGGACPGALPGTCVHQPLIQVKYLLGLDLLNRAPAGAAFTFTVSAGLPPTVPGGGAIAGLWLWSSADAGASWRPAKVVPSGQNRYQIVVKNPTTMRSGTTMWLRTEAWDSAGNRVRQTVQGAYALAGA